MTYYEPKTYELQNAGRGWSITNSGENMRFEVRSGDKWNYDSTGKERSEIASYNKLANDQYYTISYKFMIEPGATNTAAWLLMGQIHQTEDAQDKGVSPPFAIQLAGERMQIVVRSDPNAVTVTNPGTTVIYEDTANIQRGAWYDMDIQIEFDPKGEGHVNIWRNGAKIAEYTGPLGYVDAVGPYWKNGIYRASAAEQIAINYTGVDVVKGAVTPVGATTPTGPIQTITTAATTTLGALGKGLILTGSASVNGYGNGYDNTLNGNSGANILKGEGGNDVLSGFAGNDLLDGGAGADKMIGGLGDDTYYVESTGDVVQELANEGSDSVVAGITFCLPSNVEVLTLSGSGALNGMGNALANKIYGNDGANSLSGNDGDDLLSGGGGNDTLSGGNGNDVLNGGDGNDNLYGGAGVDTMTGGAGNDTYTVDNAADRIVEAANGGSDTVLSSVSYTLSDNIETLTLSGSASINGTGNAQANTINGNEAVNAIWGGAGDDLLRGNGGDDFLYGGGGADTLSGGNGADWLEGGAGADIISGGAGADRFVLTSISDSTAAGQDRFDDFSYTQGDRIDLSAIDANTAMSGDQAFRFIGSSAFSGSAGELRAAAAGNGLMSVYGDVNGDGVADVQFLVRASSLAGAEFLL